MTGRRAVDFGIEIGQHFENVFSRECCWNKLKSGGG
jgi:hypothetical protein